MGNLTCHGQSICYGHQGNGAYTHGGQLLCLMGLLEWQLTCLTLDKCDFCFSMLTIIELFTYFFSICDVTTRLKSPAVARIPGEAVICRSSRACFINPAGGAHNAFAPQESVRSSRRLSELQMRWISTLLPRFYALSIVPAIGVSLNEGRDTISAMHDECRID